MENPPSFPILFLQMRHSRNPIFKKKKKKFFYKNCWYPLSLAPEQLFCQLLLLFLFFSFFFFVSVPRVLTKRGSMSFFAESLGICVFDSDMPHEVSSDRAERGLVLEDARHPRHAAASAPTLPSTIYLRHVPRSRGSRHDPTAPCEHVGSKHQLLAHVHSVQPTSPTRFAAAHRKHDRRAKSAAVVPGVLLCLYLYEVRSSLGWLYVFP